MKESEQIKQLQFWLNKHGGIISTAEANTIGISNERLRLLTKSGILEHLAHGIYIAVNDFPDKMYITQKRRSKIIYSHETALFLHSLTDRDPISYTVTVPTGYNTKNLTNDGWTVFSIKRELHSLDSVKITTIFGNEVIAYGIERTICDCLRNRNQMDNSIILDAIKRYTKHKNKNLNLLTNIATKFKITKILLNYLDVLL